MERIIVVESDPATRRLLCEHIKRDGHSIIECQTGEEAYAHYGNGADAVVLGHNLSDMPILELVQRLRGTNPAPPIVAVSGAATDALELLRAGAYYVSRLPVSPDEVVLLLRRALEATLNEARMPQSGPSSVVEPVLIGESPAMLAIKSAVDRLRSSPATTVLIKGESGTGKDTIAHAIHAATHQGGPFVYLTPATLSERSLELELFGVESSNHNGGPRVGLLERAHGGTLFLDEITDMPIGLQARLLRFVQEKAFRRAGATMDRVCTARIIATTSHDVMSAVRKGVLRPELLHRLAVVSLEVPPLRQRRSDIPLLVEYFVALFSARLGMAPRPVTEQAFKLLVEHDWPGNVRELANVLEQAVVLKESPVIDINHLPIAAERSSQVNYRLPSGGIDFRELEREVLTQALRLAAGNQTRAASLLGMTRDQIRYRIAKFGMSPRMNVPGSGVGVRAA